MPRYDRGCKGELGIFAYLPNPTNTTTVLADTYYPISGPFTNTVAENFSIGVDYIEFDNGETVYIKIIYFGTFESDTNNTIVTTGINLNGVPIPGSAGVLELKLAGDNGTIGGVVTVEITTGDQIQLIVKSDQVGAVITANSFTTSLNRFFVGCIA